VTESESAERVEEIRKRWAPAHGTVGIPETHWGDITVLLVELDRVMAVRDEQLVARCAACAWRGPKETTWDELHAHLMACENHPLPAALKREAAVEKERDALKAELDRVTRERDEHRRAREISDDACHDAVLRLEAALAQVKQLRELRHYADHIRFCERVGGGSRCDCGYEQAALAATEPKP
jgi:hypothetical protein